MKDPIILNLTTQEREALVRRLYTIGCTVGGNIDVEYGARCARRGLPRSGVIVDLRSAFIYWTDAQEQRTPLNSLDQFVAYTTRALAAQVAYRPF